MKDNDKSPRGLLNKTSFAMPSFWVTSRRLSQLGCVVHPTSKFKRWWDLGLALCVLYNGIFCPLHVAFDLDISAAHQIIYRVVDLVFIADVFLNFNNGFYDKNSVLVMDHARIARRYINTWFVVDVISSVPVEMLYSNEDMDKAGFMRLNKLLRLFKLAKMFTVIRLGRIHRVFNRWEILPQLKYAVIDVTLHVLACVMWAHWFACAFFLCAKIDGLQQHAWFKQAQENRVWTGKLVEDPYTEYILSLYHAVMIMFTIDMNFRPENNLERLVTITFVVTPQLLHSRTIDPYAKTDLLHYYEHLRNRDHFSLELGDSVMLTELPGGLKDDVQYFMHPRLMHGELLRETTRSLAVSVLNVLIPRHVSPFEVLLAKGSQANAMFMVVHGEIEMWAFEGLEIEHVNDPITISSGDYVGQAALVELESRGPPQASPIHAASLTFCDVFKLTREAAIGLLDTLKEPERSEWLLVAAEHAADRVVGDVEEVLTVQKHNLLEQPNILALKVAELKRRETELHKLRSEILDIMSSSSSSELS